MRTGKRLAIFGTLGVLTTAVLVVSAVAQTPAIKREPARRIQSVKGVDTYQAYCAVCHGPGGKGNGPAAAALKTPPADLTTIAKRHGGKFSSTDVEAAILGDRELLPHGTREMPIWGPVFSALSSDQGMRTLRVRNLVEFLESIQVK